MESTIVQEDIMYFIFHLKEKDPTSGSITDYDLSTQNSIHFRVRKYGANTNVFDITMSTLPTTGQCRGLATVPAEGRYSSEVTVYEATEVITWKGPIYKVVMDLG